MSVFKRIYIASTTRWMFIKSLPSDVSGVRFLVFKKPHVLCSTDVKRSDITKGMCRRQNRAKKNFKQLTFFNWNSTSFVHPFPTCTMSVFVEHPVSADLLCSVPHSLWFPNLCIDENENCSLLARKAVYEDEMRWGSRRNNVIFLALEHFAQQQNCI